MSRLTLGVTDVLFKLVGVMMVLWIAHRMNPALVYGAWGAFTVALVVAVVGVITDLTLLPSLGKRPALLVDFVINTLLIWVVPRTLHNSSMHFSAALLCALVVSVLEVFLHRFMLRSERLIDHAA